MSIYEIIRPLLFLFPPEVAHRLALRTIRLIDKGVFHGRGMHAAVVHPALGQQLFGKTFVNPLGLAAGFDKNAESVAHLASTGFGFAEVGTITRYPQRGNPKPRLFRLTTDRAIINRLGFNNEGVEVALKHLSASLRNGARQIPIGVNIGINKNTQTPIEDYCYLLKRATPFADYITVNISSPNTKGLRELQRRDRLELLLKALMHTRHHPRVPSTSHQPVPLFIKLSPDLDDAELEAVAAVVLEQKPDGVIMTNTTIAHKEGLKHRYRREIGGLSGAPLFAPSTQMLAKFFYLTQGKILLIGVGGIDSGLALYQKIQAGAHLCQLYTAMVYHGPGVVQRIIDELAALMQADGVTHISEIVGINAQQWATMSD